LKITDYLNKQRRNFPRPFSGVAIAVKIKPSWPTDLEMSVELVFELSATEFLLHEAFALGVLPIGKVKLFHDVVDVSHNSLDDSVDVLRLLP
jgi:hypothetical protein